MNSNIQEFPIGQHDVEIQDNLKSWNNKPLLREIYKNFHVLIAQETLPGSENITIELGSGIGNIKEVIPHCIRTDIFANPWIDQTESAYKLSFNDNSISNIILFDVFHHLRYPGTALDEFHRVLKPGGRVIIFEPCMSVLGIIVYGFLHHEPIAINKHIEWRAPTGWNPENDSYYAAQGNAFRIFYSNGYEDLYKHWKLKTRKRFSAISYILSGGYSKPQMYPTAMYPIMKTVDTLCNFIPTLFATRALITLEKT